MGHEDFLTPVLLQCYFETPRKSDSIVMDLESSVLNGFQWKGLILDGMLAKLQKLKV